METMSSRTVALGVYKMVGFLGTKRVNFIVATENKGRALELLSATAHRFKKSGSVTDDRVAMEIAMSKPEAIFVSSSVNTDDYRETENKPL